MDALKIFCTALIAVIKTAISRAGLLLHVHASSGKDIAALMNLQKNEEMKK